MYVDSSTKFGCIINVYVKLLKLINKYKYLWFQNLSTKVWVFRKLKNYCFYLFTVILFIHPYFVFRFYINVQVMNNCCFEALNYIRERSFKEKQILFEYLFDRK